MAVEISKMPEKEFRPEVLPPVEIIFEKEKEERVEKVYNRLKNWTEKIKNSLIKEKPTVCGIPYFELEEKEIELTEQDIEILEKGIVSERAEFLEKVSEALGTNVGGWYEDRETKEKYYLKFYENPDQARVEYIANKIYQKLSIPVTESELVEVGGKLAIANKEVPATLVSKRELQSSKEIKDGFIADAYLANWDVAGLSFDNIMKGTDGRYYRIDNGGSLFFRARGEFKDYNSDSVPELISMTNREFPSGQIFCTLSEFEKKDQARKLVEALDDEFLETTVKRTGMQKELAEALLSSLKGRREYLRKRFIEGDPALIANELFEIPVSRIEKEEIFPQIEMKADGEAIEHQQIDFVRQRDKVAVYFKLREQFLRPIRDELEKRRQNYEERIALLPMFQFKDKTRFPIVIQAKGYKINLREGVDINIFYDSAIISTKKGGEEFLKEKGRALIGQVSIEIAEKLRPEMNEIMQEIEQWFDKLGIKKLWSEPKPEDIEKFVENRYLWHHKKEKLPEGIKEKLTLKEVFPGYTTVVEEGKHEEYMAKYGVKGLIMRAYPENVPAILRSAGLMSSRECFKRGVLTEGASAMTDFDTGGADFVFCRAVNQKALEKGTVFEIFFPTGGATFIVDAKELDRTDWFAYLSDQYGSTSPVFFNERPSPEEFFQKLQEEYEDRNEIMFQRGISVESLKAVVVSNESEKKKLIRNLRNHGIESIRGVPLEEYIKVGWKLSDIEW